MAAVDHSHRPLLGALREATRAEHRRLEQTASMAQLLAPDLTVEGYQTVLRVFADFYAAVDPVLTQFNEPNARPLSNYRYQARLPFLQRTMAALGDNYRATATSTVKLSCKPAPNSVNILGWAYVVEGASQGGKIIYPRLQKKLSLNDEQLLFFAHFAFEAQGWSQLQPLLMQQYSAAEQADACMASKALFNSLTERALLSSSHPSVAIKKDFFVL